MNRRTFTKRTALTIAALSGSAVGFKCGGVSKEKATKYASLVIELAEESVPLLTILGAQDLATTVDAKVIPALEKLKDALADADIPTSQSMLQNVRSVLSGIGKALLNLPESPRLITIMGILASVNVLLLTVEAFVESETPASVSGVKQGAMKASGNTDRIRRVFEASRP